MTLMKVRVKARDLLVALAAVLALVNLMSGRVMRDDAEGGDMRRHRTSGNVDCDFETGTCKESASASSSSAAAAAGDRTADEAAALERERERERRREEREQRVREREAREREREQRARRGGGGGGGSSSSATTLRATALASLRQQPHPNARASRAERLVVDTSALDGSELRPETLAQGIPHEDDVDGGGSSSGGDEGIDDGDRDPGHDLAEAERLKQPRPGDGRYGRGEEHPHDTMTKIFREELNGEAEVTAGEKAAAAAATTTATGDRSSSGGGGGSSSYGGGGGKGDDAAGDLDRAARLHAQHPDKYDRFGQIRESFLLHHLPKPPLTCPKIRGMVPTLLGLPVMLPDIISHRDVFIHQGNWAKLLGNSALGHASLRALPPNAEAIMRRYGFRSCAVVGNSGALNDAKLGRDIDSHDVVVRLNVAPVNGYEDSVGAKTSFRILNTLWSSRYGSMKRGAPWAKKSEEVPLERGATLVFTRFEPSHFADMVDFLASHGRKDVTVLMLSSRVISMVHLVEAHYRNRLCRQGYGPYPGGQTPSSGLVAVYIMMQVCRKVTGYGFGGVTDHTPAANRAAAAGGRRPPPYHYWKGTGSRTVGNEDSHSFNTEAHLVQELLTPSRKHPAAGHPWYDPDAPALRNLRMCPSVANPSAVGHQRCARRTEEARRGGGVGGSGSSSSGGVTKLHTMPS